VASIFFGVLLSTFMSSMQEGSYSSMIDNIVKFYSGYIQIHNEEYWESKTINNTFELDEALFSKIKGIKDITNYTPRLESFALASSEKITKGSMVIGIDPERENQVTGIKKWIHEGKYLDKKDNGVLIGVDLAKYLNLGVGDTLVLIGQGYHGVSAAGKYPVNGLLKFSNPDLNKQTVYMEISVCQELYTAEDRLTSMILMVEDQYDLTRAMRVLNKEIQSPYSVMSWNEMHPEILQLVEADRAGGTFMKAILYILIAFGIFGTIMMMIMERRREMGVMVAIGMQKTRLSKLLFIETVLIGIIGVLAGFAGSIPLIAYFYNHPIELTGDAAKTMIEMGIEPYMYFSWIPKVFYSQAITMFLITAVIAIYPMVVSQTMKVHMALRA
jgi:ABC-type lipoprotein release transport system permease subunit